MSAWRYSLGEATLIMNLDFESSLNIFVDQIFDGINYVGCPDQILRQRCGCRLFKKKLDGFCHLLQGLTNGLNSGELKR
jgi:hypothetical protein